MRLTKFIDPCVQWVYEAPKVHRPMDASRKGSIYDYEPLLLHFCQGQGGHTGFGA